MGLDAVELLIQIEERFQTHIPDSEAEKISTVGELHEFLMQRIQRRDSSFCLSASIFYSIRQILLHEYYVHRHYIRPNSLLNELIPLAERHHFWKIIKRELSVDLPHLKRSQIFKRKRYLFPENISTVRDLCSECVKSYSITNEFKLADRGLIWWEVCLIVADIACVEPEELFPETNFIKELGF